MAELELYRSILGPIQTNVYIIINSDTREAIIVDPADSPEAIVAYAADLHCIPVAIYLTHGHFDHIGAVDAIKAHYNIPVIAHEDEAELLGNKALNHSGMYGPVCEITADVNTKDKDILEYAGLKCEVLHTPGHTRGGCCYYFADAKLLISGDTLFQGSYGRTDFDTSSYPDMVKSIKRLLSEIPEDVTACPGHMGYTTIEAEKRYNPLA